MTTSRVGRCAVVRRAALAVQAENLGCMRSKAGREENEFMIAEATTWPDVAFFTVFWVGALVFLFGVMFFGSKNRRK